MTSHQETLASINISPEERTAIKERACEQLEATYPGQVKSHRSTVEKQVGTASQTVSDFARFYGLIGLQRIIDKRLPKTKETPGAPERAGFFAAGGASEQVTPEPPQNTRGPIQKIAALGISQSWEAKRAKVHNPIPRTPN